MFYIQHTQCTNVNYIKTILSSPISPSY